MLVGYSMKKMGFVIFINLVVLFLSAITVYSLVIISEHINHNSIFVEKDVVEVKR